MISEPIQPSIRPLILATAGLLALAILGTALGFVFLPETPTSLTAIPQSLAWSMIAASALFMLTSWLVLRSAAKNASPIVFILAILLGWYGLVVLIGQFGGFAARWLFVPNIVWAFILLATVIRRLNASPGFGRLAEALPVNRLINLQVFRVMGVGFISLYIMKLLPGAFALPTGLGDVLVGLSAPLVAYFYLTRKPLGRRLAIIWNYLGIADLIMSITLGLLTYPEPLQVIPTTVSNGPIAQFPLVLVPVFAVPLSILLHLLTLRRLRLDFLPPNRYH